MFQFIKKRWYIFVILLAIGAGVFFYQKQNADAIAKKETTHIVKRQNLKEILSFSGEIDADEKAVLRFQTSGKLSWVGVKEGDYVKKYQGIAALDQRELRKNLEKGLNTFMKYRFDFDQSKDDYGNYYLEAPKLGDEYKRILEKSQYDLNNSIIDVELKDLAMQYSYLYTPIEGIVVKVGSPNAGVNVTPTQAEFEVINPKTVYFSMTADQTEVVELKNNLVGEMVLDAYPDKKLKAKIYAISFTPKSGETGTVYEVKLKLNDTNNDYRYKIGMTGDATFKLKELNNVIAIPSSLIKEEGNVQYVFIKDGKEKKKIIIQTGQEIDNVTEIKKGLKEGDILY